jgi:methylmalonyl-CoA/ethylmalonyl-CoA epimerase
VTEVTGPAQAASGAGEPLAARLDHVAVAVGDLAAATALFCDVLGGEFIGGGDDDAKGMRSVQLRFAPGIKIELLQPLRPDSAIAAFLNRRGPGFHHVTLFVEDVAEAVAVLEAAGHEVVDTDFSRPSWHETYIRPRSAFGTLVQLATSDRDWSRPINPEITLDDVLAGRVVWVDERPEWRSEVGP